MTRPFIDPREAARLNRLRRLGLFNDSADVVLDGFTRLAAAATGMPVAALTVLGANTLLVRSAVGFPAGRVFARDDTVGAQTLHVLGVFEVEDARHDYRFQHLPAVDTGDAPGLVHYAGIPLRLPGGETVGVLCVAASQPGRLGDTRRLLLADLAGQVGEFLRLRESEQQAAREKLVAAARGAGRIP